MFGMARAGQSKPRTSTGVRGAAPYVGGKRNLSARVIEWIGRIPHRCYAEPFVGMGGVFFRRPERAASEVINDRSRDVATFFRVLQRHYVPFIEMMRWQLTTRSEFERLVGTDPSTLTDLERAARFYYLQRTTFGGKVSGRTFGVTPGQPARFDLTRLVPHLEELHERLSRVVIECLDFERFLVTYDRADTLFYLDPPYYGCEDDYGRELFKSDDFERLARTLRGLKSSFLLSINDTPEVREIFKGFAIETVRTTYTVARGGPMPAAELFIGPRGT
jgi:DNA adenine methylase